MISTAVLAVPSANAEGYYAEGDVIRTVVTWSNPTGRDDCLIFEFTRQDWSVAREYFCGGYVQFDQIANRGKWVGMEPSYHDGTVFNCAVVNRTNGSVLVQNSGDWLFHGPGGSLLPIANPGPKCMAQLL
ncbi:hypothetical protein A6I85_05820 [Prescottella equi]|nr:hypothetical protein A6I85_05820 [Prescottella equi]